MLLYKCGLYRTKNIFKKLEHIFKFQKKLKTGNLKKEEFYCYDKGITGETLQRIYNVELIIIMIKLKY